MSMFSKAMFSFILVCAFAAAGAADAIDAKPAADCAIQAGADAVERLDDAPPFSLMQVHVMVEDATNETNAALQNHTDDAQGNLTIPVIMHAAGHQASAGYSRPLSQPDGQPKSYLSILEYADALIFSRPDDSEKSSYSSGKYGYWVWNLLTGVIFYFLVARHYESIAGNAKPNEASTRLQQENAVTATTRSSFAVIFHSMCCAPARLSLTLSALGIVNYWLSLVAAVLSPCLMLCLANSCTDLNVRLGGEKQGLCMAALCSCFCSCCLIAQDAESLDRMLRVSSSLCGEPVGVAS